MKKLMFIAFASLALAMPCLAIEKENNCSTEGKQIIIRQKPLDPHGTPRSEPGNPFTAELLDTGVLLASGADWGYADVTLSSLEGDYYHTVFDMADGAIVLPVYGQAGDNYTITIIASGDLVFVGEFIL